MSRLALIIGVLLILLGVGGYFGLGRQSVTALIPAFFGVPLVVLGAVAPKAGERARMHLMHAALVVALLGLLGSAGGLPGLLKLISGAEVERAEAAVSKSIMALLCALFVVMGIKSFVDARRRPAES